MTSIKPSRERDTHTYTGAGTKHLIRSIDVKISTSKSGSNIWAHVWVEEENLDCIGSWHLHLEVLLGGHVVGRSCICYGGGVSQCSQASVPLMDLGYTSPLGCCILPTCLIAQGCRTGNILWHWMSRSQRRFHNCYCHGCCVELTTLFKC